MLGYRSQVTIATGQYSCHTPSVVERPLIAFAVATRVQSTWRVHKTEEDPQVQFPIPEVGLHVEIQMSFGRPSPSWSLREVLALRSSVKRELTVIISFDWVRRGLLSAPLWVALYCTLLAPTVSGCRILACTRRRSLEKVDAALSVRQWLRALPSVKLFKGPL